MKKIFTLLISTFLLVGCAETMVLLGPASSIIGGGNVVQSSVSSAINYGVKKQTGKSPMQHALAYAEEKNPNKEKKSCISFIEKTNSEACAIAKKQVALAKIKVKKKVKNIFKDIPLIDKSAASEKLFRTTISSRGQAFAKARKKGKDSFIFNGKIYNTKLKDVVTEKIIKSHDLVSLKNKEKNNLIKSKKSTIEQAFDVQAALNKRN